MKTTISLVFVIFCISLSAATMTCSYNGKQYSNGQEWDVGGFVMKCVASDWSWHTEIVACITPDGKHVGNNGTWKKGSFEIKCVLDNKGGRTEISACFSPKGARIPVGGSVTEGQWTWHCTKKPDGSVSLNPTRA